LALLRLLHAAASHIRVDVKTTEEEQNQGESNMTKSFVAVKNPRAVQPSQPPINSIVAAAQTAHDLDAARRKATKPKASDTPRVTRV
jgi:hypothetical protein